MSPECPFFVKVSKSSSFTKFSLILRTKGGNPPLLIPYSVIIGPYSALICWNRYLTSNLYSTWFLAWNSICKVPNYSPSHERTLENFKNKCMHNRMQENVFSKMRNFGICFEPLFEIFWKKFWHTKLIRDFQNAFREIKCMFAISITHFWASEVSHIYMHWTPAKYDGPLNFMCPLC